MYRGGISKYYILGFPSDGCRMACFERIILIFIDVVICVVAVTQIFPDQKKTGQKDEAKPADPTMGANEDRKHYKVSMILHFPTCFPHALYVKVLAKSEV